MYNPLPYPLHHQGLTTDIGQFERSLYDNDHNIIES